MALTDSKLFCLFLSRKDADLPFPSADWVSLLPESGSACLAERPIRQALRQEDGSKDT